VSGFSASEEAALLALKEQALAGSLSSEVSATLFADARRFAVQASRGRRVVDTSLVSEVLVAVVGSSNSLDYYTRMAARNYFADSAVRAAYAARPDLSNYDIRLILDTEDSPEVLTALGVGLSPSMRRRWAAHPALPPAVRSASFSRSVPPAGSGPAVKF
jgi:hypothetical protein